MILYLHIFTRNWSRETDGEFKCIALVHLKHRSERYQKENKEHRKGCPSLHPAILLLSQMLISISLRPLPIINGRPKRENCYKIVSQLFFLDRSNCRSYQNEVPTRLNEMKQLPQKSLAVQGLTLTLFRSIKFLTSMQVCREWNGSQSFDHLICKERSQFIQTIPTL